MINKPLKLTGFSLVELMTALAIMGVILLTSIPRSHELKIKKRLQREAKLLGSNIEYLAQLAQLSNSKTKLTLHKSGYVGVHKTNKIILQRTLPEGFLVNSNNSTNLNFFPKGITNPATIIISSYNLKCRITLSLRGRSLVRC